MARKNEHDTILILKKLALFEVLFYLIYYVVRIAPLLCPPSLLCATCAHPRS